MPDEKTNQAAAASARSSAGHPNVAPGPPGFVRTGHKAATRDQRRHERRAWNATLTVLFEPWGREPDCARTARVKACDLSRGGFSFVYPQYVPAGTRLTAQFDAGNKVVQVLGTVRSCRLESGVMHRIGVQFDQVQR